MKKIIAFTLVAIVVTSADAQVLKSYGLKLGAGASTMRFEYNIDFSLPTDVRWGFDGAGFIEVLSTPCTSFLAEVHYIQKGYSTTLKVTTPAQPLGNGQYLTVTPRIDYLSIPVLAKVRLETQAITPYVIVGPRLDILLWSQELDPQYTPTAFGLTCGAGIQFPGSSNPGFLLEGRFSPTLTHPYEGQILTVRNYSFEILIGAAF